MKSSDPLLLADGNLEIDCWSFQKCRSENVCYREFSYGLDFTCFDHSFDKAEAVSFITVMTNVNEKILCHLMQEIICHFELPLAMFISQLLTRDEYCQRASKIHQNL